MDLKVTAKKAGTMFTRITPEAMPFSLSSLFSTYASVAATMMLLRSMAAELLPAPVRTYLVSNFHYFFNTSLAPSMNTITVEESAGITRNQVFDAAVVYLATKIDISPNCTRFGVYKIPKQKAITAKVEKGEEIADTYEDVKLLWRFVCEEPEKEHRSREKRFLELSFEKKHRDMVMESYLPYVLARSKAITEEKRVIRLHTRDLPGECDEFGCQEWGSIELEHPATFHKLAMDHDQKAMIVNDLERFVKRREYYKKVGKAWKRGYLLFGPPGTGKSSLIAAMANYLKFDIYDLELASVYSNSDLRRLLLSTANRSILVIEDIDCNAQTKSRLRNHDYDDDDDDESDYDYDHEVSSSSKLTLSGLLNTIDGLWSSCGDERIIIFTTNHKDRLDPALLRPGRMDVHIHMSYCTPQGLRTLASNYHDVQSHPRFDEIDGLLGGAKVTPAEIAEELMKNEDGNAALEGVFNFVKRKSDAAIESHKCKKDEGDNEGGVEKKSGKKRKGKGRGGNKKRPKGG